MKKARIFIAEDEVVVARDLRELVVELGYEPAGQTALGEEAVTLAGELRPDLVLMDIHLAGEMDGIDAARIIRERWKIPSVFLTAFAEDETLARAKLAFPTGYVVKPFSERELRVAIEMALHTHRTELRRQEAEERLRLVLQGSSDSAWYRDLLTNEVFFSARWWEMVGYEPNELPAHGDLWWQLIHPDDVERARQIQSAAQSGTGSNYELEFRLRHRAGHYVPMLSRGVVARDGEGRAIRLAGTNTDLSARKRAEAALTESERILSTLIGNLPGMAFRCRNDADRTMIFVSEGSELVTGYKAGELEQIRVVSYGNLVHPADRDWLWRKCQASLDARMPCDNEYRIIAKSGEVRWVWERAVGNYAPDGTLLSIEGFVQDVTERRAAAEVLRHRNDFLSGVGRIVQELLGHRDLDELLPVAVEQVARIFDASRCSIMLRENDVLVGRAAWGTPDEDHRPILAKDDFNPAWAASLAGQTISALGRAAGQSGHGPEALPGSAIYVPVVLAGKNLGVLVVVRSESSLAFTGDEISDAGQLANSFALILHNAQLLSDLREDVRRRERAEQQILQSEQRLERVIDSAMDAVITVDGRQQIVIFNPAAEIMFRLSRAQAIGLPLDQFIPARFRSLHRRHIENYVDTGVTTRAMGRTREIFGRRADGEEFPVEASISQVRVGEELLLTVIMRDVTARVRAQREKAEIELQLRQSQKMEAIGQLAGGVAHDFNNLLTAILGNTALLQDGVSDAAMQSELLGEINQAGNRAASLTRQLLLFSRQEMPVKQTVELNRIVAELIKMLRRILGENVELQLSYASHPQVINADAGMMDQVLLNLAVNARDAMAGGGRIQVRTEGIRIEVDPATGVLVEWRGGEAAPKRVGAMLQTAPEAVGRRTSIARAGEFCCLSVADEGSGMPPEVVAHIFEPFFTTKGPGQGTGLGLATVYGIVQLHEGWVEVDSELGTGSTFRVYLPRQMASESSGGEAQQVQRRPQSHGKTILVVEDEPSVCLLLTMVLTKAGYHVIECNTAVAALELWPQQRNAIKLVITDMVMPGGISGVQLAKRLTEDEPALKVLLMSGYSANLQRERENLGFEVAFVAKPFEVGKILAAVRALLDSEPAAE